MALLCHPELVCGAVPPSRACPIPSRCSRLPAHVEHSGRGSRPPPGQGGLTSLPRAEHYPHRRDRPWIRRGRGGIRPVVRRQPKRPHRWRRPPRCSRLGTHPSRRSGYTWTDPYHRPQKTRVNITTEALSTVTNSTAIECPLRTALTASTELAGTREIAQHGAPPIGGKTNKDAPWKDLAESVPTVILTWLDRCRRGLPPLECGSGGEYRFPPRPHLQYVSRTARGARR